MLRPECYQTPIVQKLNDFQRIEKTFSVRSGFNELEKNDLMAAFKEELLELEAVTADETVEPLALASEIADNLLHVFSFANFYDFDFEAALAQASHIKLEDFSLAEYKPNQLAAGTNCQQSGGEILTCLHEKRVDKIALKQALISHFNNLIALANQYHLSPTKILSCKINRNFYKYAGFKDKLTAGYNFAQARSITKQNWAGEQEDKRFLQDCFEEKLN